MKRRNKKGFTLAELLIVVAILAILIAVAIPIYTSAMRDAQIRVNTSNARALRGAAVAQILSNWTGEAKTAPSASDKTTYSAGETTGWWAVGKFDENGKMTDVGVYVCAADHRAGQTGPSVVIGGDFVSSSPISTDPGATKGSMEEIGTTGSGSIANPNYIIVHISGTDLNK